MTHETISVDSEYNIRGIYGGMVGWYAEDTAELHPPTDAELGSVVTEGFGGADKLIARAQAALDERKYNLAAKLMSYVFGADPENADAGLLKAKALRAMAQATRTGIQTRNFLLTHALHLEGKLDWTQPPEIGLFAPIGVDTVLATPPGTYLELLEFYVDPVASAQVNAVARVTEEDTPALYMLLRRTLTDVGLATYCVKTSYQRQRAQV